jgi:hypothetical protein
MESGFGMWGQDDSRKLQHVGMMCLVPGMTVDDRPVDTSIEDMCYEYPLIAQNTSSPHLTRSSTGPVRVPCGP